MLRRIMPSPAMGVALLALFVALGTGAYAQVANSVGTAQLRNGAVTHPKLAHNSVWHANIGRHSVRNNNLAHNSVWHAQLGGGVVRRNNVFAPLLAELGPARTLLDLVARPDAVGALPPNQTTVIGTSAPITTTSHENTLVTQVVATVQNTGPSTATASRLQCLVGSRPEAGQFVGSITVGVPPAPNDVWVGQIVVLGWWTVPPGNHTVTLECHPFAPPTGTASIRVHAQVLLAAMR